MLLSLSSNIPIPVLKRPYHASEKTNWGHLQKLTKLITVNRMYFMSRCKVIVWVSVVLNRTTVDDSHYFVSSHYCLTTVKSLNPGITSEVGGI